MTDIPVTEDDLQAPEVPTFEAARFRQVMGHFASGITVVTAVGADGPIGLTAQSFVSLSLDPPLVALCPARTSSTWPRIRDVGAFCVNILGEQQEDVCRAFAMSGADKFAGVQWIPGPTGSPVLSDVLAWADCRLEVEHDGGDHVIVVGRVVDLDVNQEGSPLLFYRGGYGRFAI